MSSPPIDDIAPDEMSPDESGAADIPLANRVGLTSSMSVDRVKMTLWSLRQ